MTRRWRGMACAVLIVVLAFIADATTIRSQDYGSETMETFFFLDLKTFKVKIYEIPTGRIIVDETENIESTLGSMGVAIAKKYPKTWLVMGPIMKTSEQVPPNAYLKECMKVFDLSYLGSVAVKAPVSEITEPDAPDQPPAPQPQPKAENRRSIKLEELWGSATNDPEDDDPPPPSTEDDPDEPSGPPEPEVDAFVHIWRFNGKKANVQ